MSAKAGLGFLHPSTFEITHAKDRWVGLWPRPCQPTKPQEISLNHYCIVSPEAERADVLEGT